MTVINSRSIEIAAPPSLVRAKFLDFSSLLTYHLNGFFISENLKSETSPKKVADLQAGDKIRVEHKGKAMELIVSANTPSRFAWTGSFSGSIWGEHGLRFEESTVNIGGTTLVHEGIDGSLAAGRMGEGWLARQLGWGKKMEGWAEKGLGKFNKDLKAWCEGSE